MQLMQVYVAAGRCPTFLSDVVACFGYLDKIYIILMTLNVTGHTNNGQPTLELSAPFTHQE